MSAGIIDQKHLITNIYQFEETQRAMDETLARKSGFVKSIIIY